MPTALTTDARDAYEALAPAYDALTADYPYAVWLRRLVALSRELGGSGDRALDLACGTGNSFVPLVELGYRVTAADISPAMCAAARRKSAGAVRVVEADMRALSPLGEFDLITCIDDSINYLLDPAELVATFRGVRAQLAPGGFFVFDVNTLRAHREGWSSNFTLDAGDHVILWTGTGPADLESGGLTRATVDTFSSHGDVWRRTSAEHRQRNHSLTLLVDALADADLEVAAVRGQHPGAVLEEEADENVHTKFIVVARPRKESAP